jgi:hypothetical protein
MSVYPCAAPIRSSRCMRRCGVTPAASRKLTSPNPTCLNLPRFPSPGCDSLSCIARRHARRVGKMKRIPATRRQGAGAPVRPAHGLHPLRIVGADGPASIAQRAKRGWLRLAATKFERYRRRLRETKCPCGSKRNGPPPPFRRNAGLRGPKYLILREPKAKRNEMAYFCRVTGQASRRCPPHRLNRQGGPVAVV